MTPQKKTQPLPPGSGTAQVAPPGPGNTTAGAAQGGVQNVPGQQGGILAITIPAGQTIPQLIQGSFFYVIAASAGILVRPKGGSFNTYQPGTGYRLPGDQSFSSLEIENPNAFPVSFAMFIGFGEFIDNRLILQQGVQYPVMKVTYSGVPEVAGPIAITDVSGSAFTDQNGKSWLAISRICFYVDNLSTSANLILQDSASDGNNCGTIFPATTRTFPVSGNFTLKTGAAPVAACVIEVYNAIAPAIPL
jgi:hypothetical protein